MTAQQIIRTSERKTFKRCPQRWWWGYREGLTLAGPPSDALWFGTGWHEVMAHWYSGPGLKRGANPLKVWRDWVDEEHRLIRVKFGEHDSYREETYVEARKLGEAMLEHYFDTYAKDLTWSVIRPETPFQVRIPSFSDSLPRILYAGTYDLVYRDLTDDSIWLGEHKTAKAISTGHLPMDDQAGSYWAVADTNLRREGTLKKGESLRGIMYNFARKGVPDDRPKNAKGEATNKPVKQDYIDALWAHGIDPTGSKTLPALVELADKHDVIVLGEASKVQPATLLLREAVYRTRGERRRQIERIQSEGAVMAQMADGSLPLFKNPTRDCSWDCDFYQLCTLDESGADTADFIDAVYKVRDPYEDHRKSASGD